MLTPDQDNNEPSLNELIGGLSQKPAATKQATKPAAEPSLNELAGITPKPTLAEDAADVGRLFLQGTSNVGGAIGYGLEKSGIAPDIGRTLQDSDKANADRLQANLSPAMQEAARQPLINDDNSINPNFGVRSIVANVVPSIPGTLAMGVAGAPLAGAAGAALKGLGVAEKTAAFAGSGLGFGASEGVFSGAQNAEQWGQEQRAKPIEAFTAHPNWQTALEANNNDPLAAKESLINQGQNDIFQDTALKTGAISALTGGGMMGVLRGGADVAADAVKDGFIKATAKSIASEAGQEAPQSYFEQRTTNQATQDYVDPNQDVNQGALNAGAIGGIAGGVMGAAGGITHLPPLSKAAAVASQTGASARLQTQAQVQAEAQATGPTTAAAQAAPNATSEPAGYTFEQQNTGETGGSSTGHIASEIRKAINAGIAAQPGIMDRIRAGETVQNIIDAADNNEQNANSEATNNDETSARVDPGSEVTQGATNTAPRPDDAGGDVGNPAQQRRVDVVGSGDNGADDYIDLSTERAEITTDDAEAQTHPGTDELSTIDTKAAGGRRTSSGILEEVVPAPSTSAVSQEPSNLANDVKPAQQPTEESDNGESTQDASETEQSAGPRRQETLLDQPEPTHQLDTGEYVRQEEDGSFTTLDGVDNYTADSGASKLKPDEVKAYRERTKRNDRVIGGESSSAQSIDTGASGNASVSNADSNGSGTVADNLRTESLAPEVVESARTTLSQINDKIKQAKPGEPVLGKPSNITPILKAAQDLGIDTKDKSPARIFAEVGTAITNYDAKKRTGTPTPAQPATQGTDNNSPGIVAPDSAQAETAPAPGAVAQGDAETAVGAEPAPFAVNGKTEFTRPEAITIQANKKYPDITQATSDIVDVGNGKVKLMPKSPVPAATGKVSDVFRGHAQKLFDSANDWANRNYKNTTLTYDGKDQFGDEAGPRSVKGANERRRAQRVKEFTQDGNAFKAYADMLDSFDENKLHELAQRTREQVDSDVAKYYEPNQTDKFFGTKRDSVLAHRLLLDIAKASGTKNPEKLRDGVINYPSVAKELVNNILAHKPAKAETLATADTTDEDSLDHLMGITPATGERGPLSDNSASIADLEAQLRDTESELAGQGQIQNAVTRRKRDMIRNQLAEAKYPGLAQHTAQQGDIAIKVGEAIDDAKLANWQGDQVKERVIQNAIHKTLKAQGWTDDNARQGTEKIFNDYVLGAKSTETAAPVQAESSTQSAPILNKTKQAYILDQKAKFIRGNKKATKAAIDNAVQGFESSYDAEFNKAAANAPFEQYAALPSNKGIPESMLRQAHEQLRADHGIAAQANDPGAAWDKLDYGGRQAIAQKMPAGSMRNVVHRLSGSKWAELSPGEQQDAIKAMAPAETKPDGEPTNRIKAKSAFIKTLKLKGVAVDDNGDSWKITNYGEDDSFVIEKTDSDGNRVQIGRPQEKWSLAQAQNEISNRAWFSDNVSNAAESDTQADLASAPETKPTENLAPGTRINGQAEREHADRLTQAMQDIRNNNRVDRNTREGNAIRAVEMMADELRKPQTVSSVEAVLEKAANDLAKWGAQSNLIFEVIDKLTAETPHESDSKIQTGADNIDSGTSSNDVADSGAGPRVSNGRSGKSQATPNTGETKAKPEKQHSAEYLKAQADLDKALGDLGEIFLSANLFAKKAVPTELNVSDLVPVLAKVMDAAFRMGYASFKENARFVLDTIRDKFGDAAADSINLNQLQGSYITMGKGTTSNRDVVSIESLDELTATPETNNEIPEHNEPAPAIDFAAAQAFANRLLNGESFKTIVAARKALTSVPIQAGTDVKAKQADEMIELAGVLAARRIVKEQTERGLDPKQIYDSLVSLAEGMPALNVRTSTSVEQQAYSTPLPLAYVASQRAGITSETTVAEPAAGNGALLIGTDPENVVAVELNPDRAENLRAQGYTVGVRDATKMIWNGKHAVVIANPPFGVVKDDDGNTKTFRVNDQYSTNEIDHVIALRALEGMDDNGRAVLIVGGPAKTLSDKGRSDAYNGKAKRAFYYTLYNDYNVTDHFTVSGDLYAKQGAAWPVDVIVIEGRGKSALKLPAAAVPRLINSFEELRNELTSNRPGVQPAGNAIQQDGAKSPGGGTSAGGSVGSRGGNRRPGSGEQSDELLSGPSTSPKESGTKPPTTTDDRGDTSANRPPRTGADSPAIKNKFQAKYTPSSAVASVDTLVPVNMQGAINDALARLRDKHGDVDQYVARELGYKPSEIGKYFSAEQVDAIGLALSNISDGKGFIIGDQTGVGKGRVNAAMIRYAIKNKMVPIFITEKSNLYGDMIRDLTDIGMGDIKPFATNAGLSIPLDAAAQEWYELAQKAKNDGEKAPAKYGEFINMPGSTVHARAMVEMQNAGKLKGYDVIFTTYSQMQTINGGARTDRMDFLEAMSDGSLLILDESHNAGGTSTTQKRGKNSPDVGEKTGRAAVARNMVGKSQGTFYSSATYAKRPDVLDLYSKTDMGLVADQQTLQAAMTAGGVPLQQAVASMLAKAGQYIRREKSFDGIVYDTRVVEVDRPFAENASTIMRGIMRFDKMKLAALEAIDSDIKAGAHTITGDRSTGGAGASSTSFASVMHNMISQMLLTLKVQPTIDETLEALRRGEKPVIALSNTMGSAIEDYVADAGLNPGDAIGLTFGDLLKNYLKKSRRVIEGSPFGQKTSRYMTDAELGPATTKFYNKLLKQIDDLDFSKYPISPIDAIHHALAKAGYKSGEITGRTSTIDYSNGSPIYKRRSSQETTPAGKRKTINDFNNGKLDVIVLNQSGATGLSLHASPKAGTDTRKRYMIIAQPELNIDTHMQMLGRINRTGQLVLPAYAQLTANIPAEKRPSAILAKKMAMLNANTTAGKDSAVKAKDVPDFMNDYGDEIAAQIMNDNREIHDLLGTPLHQASNGAGFEVDGAMRKVTGRIPVLTLADQEHLYAMIEDAYNEYIDMLTKTGQNMLEAEALALDAKTTHSQVIVDGVRGSDSPFAEPVTAETVDVKRLGKPFTMEQINDLIVKTGVTDAASRVEWQRGLFDKLDAEFARQSAEIEAMPEDEQEQERRKRGARDNLESQIARIKAVVTNFGPGKAVQMTSPQGLEYLGIVGKFERKGDAKNYFAAGNWKLTVYVADPAKQFLLPLSKFQVLVGNDSNPIQGVWAMEPANATEVKEAIEEGQSTSREERVILTGNMLSAYGFDKSGRIVNYTTDTGEVRQGVLMPKKFELEKAIDAQPVLFAGPELALDYLRESDSHLYALRSSDNGVRIIPDGRGAYRLYVPASKAKGAMYFTHPRLTEALGDFVKSGRDMAVAVPANKLEEVLRTIYPLTGSMQPVTKSIGKMFMDNRDKANGKISEKTNPYGISEGTEATYDVGRGTGALQRAKVVNATKGTMPVGITQVNSPEDALHIAAPIRKQAQEQMLAIVLDKDNNVLQVLRHTIGLTDSSQVDVAMLAGAIHGVDGARFVYFAHNHPSGESGQSKADYNITYKLGELLRGSGVKSNGMVVTVAGKRGSFFDPYINEESRPITPTVAPRNKTVPITERVIVRNSKLHADAAIDPKKGRAITADVAKGRTGVVLLDDQHRAVGFVPMALEEMAKLRTFETGTGASRLLREIHETNARAAFVNIVAKNIAESDIYDIPNAHVNIERFINASGTSRLLDVFVNGQSYAEQGRLGGAGDSFKSTRNDAGTGSTVAEINARLPAKVKAVVDVVQSAGEVPQAAYAFDAGGVEGFYDPKADKLYLVADNIDPANLDSVLHHELLHRAEATDPQLKTALNRFEADFKERFNVAASNAGDAIERAAYQRVIKANTPKADQLAEFRAYLVSEYAKDPKSFVGKIKRVITDFIGAIRAALVRAGLDFGTVRHLNAADLYAMSKYGIRAGARSSGETDQKSVKQNSQFSIRSDVTDFMTGTPRTVDSLADIDTILNTGRMPQKRVDMRSVLDKAATMLVDSTRPFDAHMRSMPDVLGVAKVIAGKDTAKRKTAVIEKHALDTFLKPVATIVGAEAKRLKWDYRATQEIIGNWMTARYALEKNQDYMRQDQARVDAAESALEDDPENSQLKAALTRAKNHQAARREAINEQKFIDPRAERLDAKLAGGYNDFTAKEMMDRYEAKIDRGTLEDAAEHIYAMMRWKVDMDLDTGKVTQEQVDQWFNSPYYVPLTGDPSVDTSDDELFQHGSVNQAADKQAIGRSGSIAQNGIDAAVEQVQKSARYAGWDDFKTALSDLYDNLIEAETDTGATMREAQAAVLKQYGLSRKPLGGDGFVPATGITYRKGTEKWVFDLNNQVAVDALKSANKDDIPSVLQPVAFFTRNYARFVTQLLPGFGAINAIRDTWERSENIRARTLPGYETLNMDQVARNAIKHAADVRIVRKLMGVMLEGTGLEGKIAIDAADPDIKVIHEMINAGATSTVGDYLGNSNKELAKQMRDTLKLTTKGWDYVSAWNSAFELVSSYSLYRSLREAGVDEKTAAAGTLNLMNFGKTGTIVGPLRALYVFVNPVLQGGHQLVQTLSSKKGQARAAAYLIAGLALYAMLRAADGDDDELGENKMDNQSNFMLERNIYVPIGGDEYAKVPIGFGLPQAMWGAAINIDKMLFGKQSLADTAIEIVKSFSRTLAPVAPSEAPIGSHPIIWAAQTFAPQIAKPIVNVGLDKNMFGQSLTNSKFNREDVALALQGRKSTAQEYKDIAGELGKLGISMYPEQVREMIRGYAVGPFNEIVKAMIENPNKEALGRASISSALDRYVASHDSGGLKERLYYRYRDEMNQAASKHSLGETLSTREAKMVDMNDKVHKMESRANGKLAAATKYENEHPGKVSHFRKQGEAIRDTAMNLVIKAMQNDTE